MKEQTIKNKKLIEEDVLPAFLPGAEKVPVGIVGGAGYTGGELTRLLLNHPGIVISFIHSRSNAGKPVASVHQDLLGETDLVFTGGLSPGIDVLFLCVGHGEAKKFLTENVIDDGVKIIDLSQDFRLSKGAAFQNRNFIYGLPELNRQQIQSAQNIANPGCFATCIQLGLLPLAKAGLLADVYTTGITGSTGAGQSLSTTSHFSWRANNIQAYKTLTHQHLGEIYQSLHQLNPLFPPSPSSAGEGQGVRFIPWRGDFTRGIFVSSIIKCDWSLDRIRSLYHEFYADAAFTFVSPEPVSLKQVVNTNRCILGFDAEGSNVVVHSAIDNLLKGACGQAVQNMNIMLGFNERSGLNLKPLAF